MKKESVLGRAMGNIIDLFKDENVKKDLITASQFNENIEDENTLSLVKLYVNYETKELVVLTQCKNSEGKEVTKSVNYLVKDLNNKDNKIPAEIEECLHQSSGLFKSIR